jgi:sugar lactone lactonase YvrE
MLWKGWPEPVKAGRGSPQLQQILIPGEEWQLVAEGFQFTEGPTAAADGTVMFSDVRASKIHRITADGKVETAIAESNRGNGQALGPDGRVYLVASGTEQILAYDKEGKTEVIAEGIRGNDLVVLASGRIYVTNPGNGVNEPSRVWTIGPDRSRQVVDTGLRFSNGVAVSPDQSLLYVADARSHWVYSYKIAPDGSLIHKQRYYHLHRPDAADDSGADGMRTDTEGRLYVATRMGIQVCDQAGRVNAIIPTPNGRVSNLCFAGPDSSTIYATCGDKVYKRKVAVRGARPDQAPIKPVPPRL